jgi:hypothetical protein
MLQMECEEGNAAPGKFAWRKENRFSSIPGKNVVLFLCP